MDDPVVNPSATPPMSDAPPTPDTPPMQPSAGEPAFEHVVPAAAVPLPHGTILSLREDRPEALQRAVAELRAGGVVVLPTDTVYGIAANAFDRSATARIFQIKRRPRSLPLPVLVSRPRQAWALCSDVPSVAAELAAAFWPGALTLVLRGVEGLDWDLGDGDGTIAMRIPAQSDLVELLERVGPLACTSANLTGEPTPPTVPEIQERLGDGVGVYLDGGAASADRGSTIVDCTGPEVRIIREGLISALQVRAAANRV